MTFKFRNSRGVIIMITFIKINALKNIIFVWILVGETWTENCTQISSKTPAINNRTNKAFPIFTLVKFPNSLCAGNVNFNGTCESRKQCVRNGGSVFGSCALNYGSCCIYRLSCGSTIRSNVTYFTNPGYPSASSGPATCAVTVNKVNRHVVQLRLDFDVFSLNGVTGGECATDAFRVTGQNVDQLIPPICGSNNGQHIYVYVGNTAGPINLSVSTTGSGDRQWKIRIIQLERGNSQLAPSNCLQYFTEFSGLLKSFNFDSPTPPSGQSNYLNNLNYAICIRRVSGNCQVRYTVTSDVNSFDLEIPELMSGVDGSCLGDYLVIPGATNAPVTNAGGTAATPIGSRFCGVALSATAASVTSNPIISGLSGPIQLAFITNGQIAPGSSDRGFSITYQQVPCTSLQ